MRNLSQIGKNNKIEFRKGTDFSLGNVPNWNAEENVDDY